MSGKDTVKKIIEEKGVSLYRVAKGSGLPYTTVYELASGRKDPQECSLRTMARLAAYLQMSLDGLFMQISDAGERPSVRPADSWNAARYRKYRFPVVCSTDGFDISRIHPLKQRDVLNIYDSVCGDKTVAELIVFGSASNIRCTKNSDIDIAMSLAEHENSASARDLVSEKVQQSCGWNADILWMDNILPGTRIYDNIMRGVRLI